MTGKNATDAFFLATQGALVAAGGLTYRIPAVKNMGAAVQALTPLYLNDPVTNHNLDKGITSSSDNLAAFYAGYYGALVGILNVLRCFASGNPDQDIPSFEPGVLFATDPQPWCYGGDQIFSPPNGD